MARHMATGSAQSSSRGFTYIGLLITIAVIGLGLAATGAISHTLQQREKERELLFIGDQFRRAIALYYERSPGGLKQYPKKLEDLLGDNRYPTAQRYLRRIYADPLTGKKQWGLIELPGIGITGVHSLSEVQPLKTANFSAPYQTFRSAKKYSDWKFVYVPGQAASPSAVPQSGAQSPAPAAR